MFSKTEFAIVSNLRFISRTNFILSSVENEKKFYNLGAWLLLLMSCSPVCGFLILSFQTAIDRFALFHQCYAIICVSL